ncbi:MAG: hypothetical protein ACRCX2_33730 [Paraclostridium sp.]
MILTDFDFYIENYGGEFIPNEKVFYRMNVRASGFINKITFNRIDNTDIYDVAKSVQFAVCAVADEMYKADTIGLKTTETVGNHTVSYLHIEKKESDKKLYDLARIYLSEDLLYRGVY